MNTFRITTITLATAALLVGCNEYELEGSAIRAFKTAYDKNFTNNVGDIDPNQSWDFSTAGGNRGKAAVTRAVHLNDDDWYYPEDQTLDWMHDKLTEKRDNSGQCKDFYLSWTPGMSFQIVPIWEGYATMKWDLHMKVTPAEGGTALYDQMIWSKGDNVEILTQNGPAKTTMQYEENEICVWFEYFGSNGNVLIWPYSDSHDGSYYTGQKWATTSMQKVDDRNYCCPLNAKHPPKPSNNQRIRTQDTIPSPHVYAQEYIREGYFSPLPSIGGPSTILAIVSSQSFSGCSRNP